MRVLEMAGLTAARRGRALVLVRTSLTDKRIERHQKTHLCDAGLKERVPWINQGNSDFCKIAEVVRE